MSEEKETTIQQLKTSMKEMLDLCRTAEQKISSTQAFINYFSPHMDTVTDLLDEIFVLVAWKKFNDHKEAENATKKRQREEEEEKERGRARNSGKKTMGMREILELEANKEKFGVCEKKTRFVRGQSFLLLFFRSWWKTTRIHQLSYRIPSRPSSRSTSTHKMGKRITWPSWTSTRTTRS